jgi:hypothetical protein
LRGARAAHASLRSLDVPNERVGRATTLHSIGHRDDPARRENLLVDQHELRRRTGGDEGDAGTQQYGHHGQFYRVDQPGFEKRPEQRTAAEQPDVASRLLLQRRDSLTRVAVDDADALTGRGGQRSGEDHDVETRHRGFRTLRSSHFVCLSTHNDGIEFFVQHGEIDRRIHDDPVDYHSVPR